MNEMQEVRVILVEDDEDVRIGSRQALELAGFTVDCFESVEEARASIGPNVPAVVLLDVKLPGISGLDWLQEIQALDKELPVILVTGHGDIAMAVQAIRDGAYDFVAKPFSADHLTAVVRRAADKRRLTLQVARLRDQLQTRDGVEIALIGRSVAMERVRQLVRALASTSVDVMIYGETGTGKDVVARCLHSQSNRSAMNFVALNCGGMPENLAESELFGHEAGSFTGATRTQIGKLEHANGGTLFLDEIESMPIAIQVKFLRALQERVIERVGAHKAIHIDTRVVAASKEDLRALSVAHRFRADLYYRIAVAFIELPPLRARREDIPLLFEHFTLCAATRYQRTAPVLSSTQLADLVGYDWPGNVRELRNVADRFVLGLLGDGPISAISDGPSVEGLPERMEKIERVMIKDELRRHGGDAGAAAVALGIPKPTLYDKARRLGIRVGEFRDGSGTST
ncbi:MAG: sigma-54 dependent transcriptional regulator [Pseudomonadota bacterium]|nr:sigma-54 dependent transcriptional regulator [Pseudomonadota bacterium]